MCKLIPALAISLFFVSSSAWAHHATASQYDVSTTIKLTGKISLLEWSNPHVHVYVEVKMDDGNTGQWTVEFPSPGAAVVAGLSKKMLAPGTLLTIEAYPSKPGADQSKAQYACAKAMTLTDGSRFTFVVGI